MALKITLKPRERMVLGGAVISNATTKSSALIIENNVPILRRKDILTEKDANSPCRRIYFIIQLMYVDEEHLVTHHRTYWKLVQGLVKAAPSTLVFIDQISMHILAGRYYQALKVADKLIHYEREISKGVRESAKNLRIR